MCTQKYSKKVLTNVPKKCQKEVYTTTQHYPKKVSTNVQKKCFTATSWQQPLLNVTLQQIGLLDILFWEFYRLFSQTIQWIHLDNYMSSNILTPLCRQILEIFLNYFPKHFPHILNKKMWHKIKIKKLTPLCRWNSWPCSTPTPEHFTLSTKHLQTKKTNKQTNKHPPNICL